MERRIAKFEKVSKEQFIKDFGECIPMFWDIEEQLGNNREESEMKLGWILDDIKLPKRSTVGSAGYDFYSPINFELKPGESITIPTGVRCQIDPNWVLCIFARSGLGFKYRAILANGTGIIDEDYYYSDNEGHMRIKLCNDGDKTLTIKEGDGIAQGIFFLYGITKDDNTDGIRNGGFGSTDKK